MDVRGLDDKSYKINLSQYRCDRVGASAPHKLAVSLLRGLYPSSLILQEVALPGCGATLYIDIFVPSLRVAIEVNGQQHNRFTPFFHMDKAAYFRAKANDRKKAEWLELNDIRLIIFDDSEDEDQWKTKLLAIKPE